MANLANILAAFPWWAWIAVIAILGGLIRQVISMNHKHRERMEMIRQGMDPRDYNKP
ncbi:MAG: hypothetical protein IPK83_04635 [Planctomycetes bacterium]|nr:hypothetical protein [Planctomycetota bacterium]